MLIYLTQKRKRGIIKAGSAAEKPQSLPAGRGGAFKNVQPANLKKCIRSRGNSAAGDTGESKAYPFLITYRYDRAGRGRKARAPLVFADAVCGFPVCGRALHTVAVRSLSARLRGFVYIILAAHGRICFFRRIPRDAYRPPLLRLPFRFRRARKKFFQNCGIKLLTFLNNNYIMVLALW